MLFYWNHKRFRNFALMKKMILSITTLLAIVAMTSCDNRQQGLDYTVQCTLQGKHTHDSATLLVLEQDYNRLRVCAAQHSSQGTFTFKGQTDHPKAALIRWDNDTTRPFYFVLEPGHTRITINDSWWRINGSASNRDYQHFIRQHDAIINQRQANWQQYLSMAADSSLRRDDELRMVSQDSLLNDSLQRAIVERINRGDAVGHIIRERYGKQLDRDHARLLKH